MLIQSLPGVILVHSLQAEKIFRYLPMSLPMLRSAFADVEYNVVFEMSSRWCPNLNHFFWGEFGL